MPGTLILYGIERSLVSTRKIKLLLLFARSRKQQEIPSLAIFQANPTLWVFEALVLTFPCKKRLKLKNHKLWTKHEPNFYIGKQAVVGFPRWAQNKWDARVLAFFQASMALRTVQALVVGFPVRKNEEISNFLSNFEWTPAYSCLETEAFTGFSRWVEKSMNARILMSSSNRTRYLSFWSSGRIFRVHFPCPDWKNWDAQFFILLRAANAWGRKNLKCPRFLFRLLSGIFWAVAVVFYYEETVFLLNLPQAMEMNTRFFILGSPGRKRKVDKQMNTSQPELESFGELPSNVSELNETLGVVLECCVSFSNSVTRARHTEPGVCCAPQAVHYTLWLLLPVFFAIAAFFSCWRERFKTSSSNYKN